MKSFFTWTATIATVSIGAVIGWTLVQAGRRRLRTALERAERVADATRVTLEETESALHEMRTSV